MGPYFRQRTALVACSIARQVRTNEDEPVLELCPYPTSMNPLRRLRQSYIWGKLTEDQIAHDADLLPVGWAFKPSAALFYAAGGALLGASAAGWLGKAMVPVGQIGIFLVVANTLPTVALYWAARRWGRNPPVSLLAGLLVVVCLPNMAVTSVCVWFLPFLDAWIRSLAPPWRLLAPGAGMVACLSFLMFLQWRASVLEGLRREVRRQRQLADDAQQERQLAEARLQTLQAQIEPHFLYNTLANVQHLIAHRPDDADAMLSGLIRYLRESLPQMRARSSTLEQEFALSLAYLDIARIRLGGRLKVESTLPDELRHAAFPPLVIQTLVENALKHGIEPKVGLATVRLESSATAGDLTVRVVDDGVGFGETQGSGVGLRNVRERLAAIYGKEARLTLQANTPSGVIAVVSIPSEAS